MGQGDPRCQHQARVISGPAAHSNCRSANGGKDRCCAGFRTPAITGPPTRMRPAFEKRQDTKSRREVVAAVPQALWDFGHGRELEAGQFARAVRVEREYNLNVTARILLKRGIHVLSHP